MKPFPFTFRRPLFAVLAWLFAGATLALAQTALPNAQVGVAYTYTVTTTPAAPAGTVYGATGLPTGLSINTSSGVISGTPTTAGNNSGTISLTASGITNNFSYTLLVNPGVGTPAITSATTLAATAGTPIATYTVTASNTPTSFNVGSLPAGLSLGGTNTAPTISGTPTTAGTYTVALSANNGSGTGASVTLTLTIAASGVVPAITSATTASSAVSNAAFSYAITTSTDGTANAPVSYSAIGLPLNLSLNSTTGVISAINGGPTVAGISSVTLSAKNNNGTGPTTTLTLTIGSVSAITSASTASATVSIAFSFAVTASNSPASFNISGLPPGLSANSTSGLISGTPTTAGTFTVTASANNATGTGAASTFTLTVAAAPTGGGGGGGGTIATAPIITTQPVAQSVTEGTDVSFSVAAAGTGTLSYQWRKDGTAIAGATAATLTLPGVKAADAAGYAVLVSNSIGSILSNTVALAVTVIVTPPSIATQPTATTGSIGGGASFSVVASGTAPFTYQWRKDGTAISGATSAALSLTNLKATDAGNYSVVVTNSVASVTSSSVALVVTTVPAIATAPGAQTIGLGGTATFTVVAGGTGPFTYQWTKDGVAIAGATSATLSLSNAGLSAAGNYAVVVTNAAGSVTSTVAALVVNPPSSRLINLATRGAVGTGDRMLIAGFVIQGTAPKSVLIRAVGPTLGGFGVPGTLADPVLELFRASTALATNDNWGSADAAAIAAAGTRVGAFALAAGSADSAILTTLTPGNYTAQVRGANGATGVGLVEIYDAGDPAEASRLGNVATRGDVGTGANLLIAGFVIRGDVPKQVLIRAIGPGLTAFGLPGAVADPKLQLFRESTLLNENDNWGSAGDAASLAAAGSAVGAFGLTAGSKDAVLLVTLAPGNYTAQVSATGAAGIALVEVYEVP